MEYIFFFKDKNGDNVPLLNGSSSNNSFLSNGSPLVKKRLYEQIKKAKEDAQSEDITELFVLIDGVTFKVNHFLK